MNAAYRGLLGAAGLLTLVVGSGCVGILTSDFPGTGAGGSTVSFYTTVNSGSMPPGGPKLSAANLALIKAWIDAGALNN